MADDDHTCPGLVQACEALSKALTEQDRLRAALATALADRDAHVRGYEDMEQRHAAVVAERDQMRRERDEAREDAAEDAGDYEKMLGEVRAERDALRAEVERLQYQCNEQVQENADLRAVTAARADGCSYCHGALLCPIHRGKHRAGKP